MATFTILFLTFLYFFPSVVGGMRRHHNAGAIMILNLFFGWTLIGWVLSLVWAATMVKKVQ